MKDYVVMLHGILRSSLHMKNLENLLKNNGYEVFNLDYPSTKKDIQSIATKVNEQVQDLCVENKAIHYIGYSMGGLILRAMLADYKPKNLGKVIQLASPNHGSEVADFFKKNWLYKKILGPAGSQLVTDCKEFDNSFSKFDCELGIVAGNKTLDPICSLILPKGNDGKVSIESTKINGMKDHIVVPASHYFFPSSKHVHKQVLHFLLRGEFDHNRS